MTTPDLTPATAALARERTYRLFSQLYLRGLSSSLLPLIRALPGLAERVPAEVNEDIAATDHHHLFRFNLFPYQSIFLNAEGLLGGAESDRVRRSYRLCGFAVEEDGSPDHVGHELNLMRSAAQYEAFPALIRSLQEVASEWAVAYGRQREKMPALSSFCRPWQARVEATVGLLTEMEMRSKKGVHE